MNPAIKITPIGLIVVAVFFPFFKNILLSTTLAQFFSVSCLIILSMLFFLRKDFKKLKVPDLAIIYAFIFIVALLGSLYYESSPSRMLSDSFRYIVFSYFIFLGYNFNRINDEQFFRAICGIAILQVLFSLLVFVPSVHGFVDLFKGRLSTGQIPFHFYRFSGSLGYPTEFGCFLLIPVFYMLSRNLFVKNFYYFSVFLVLCLGIVFSVSRGALLGLGIFVIGFLLQRFIRLCLLLKFNLRIAFLFGFFVMSVLVFSYFQSPFEYETLSLIGYLSSLTNGLDSSILHRFHELELSLLILIGEVSVPTSYERIAPFGLEVLESFWGSVIIRFGWFGVFIIVLLNAGFLIKIFHLNRYQIKSFSAFVIVWFITMYLFVAPFSEVIFRSKGSVIFGLILGISLSCLKELKSNKYLIESINKVNKSL